MSLPDRIPCKCGDLKGDLVLKQAVIEFTDDSGKKRRVQPSEFESVGGKAAAKKWKSSIKIRGISGFDGREIGLYLREELGVDINRGVFTMAVSAKPGTQAKPVASSKAAVAKLAVAVKGGAHVSKSPRGPIVTSMKRPLEDRLQAQFENTFVCYEVPTPSKMSAGDGKPSNSVQLSRAWPQVSKPSSGELSWSAAPEHVIVVPTDDACQGSEHTMADMVCNDIVEIVNGRPGSASACILDLAETPFSCLFSLGKDSGSDKAFSGSILKRVPDLPAGKASTSSGAGHVSGHANSGSD